MHDLSELFEERLGEINAYLELLDGIERLVRSGVPRLGDDGPPITTKQQRILNSGLYLQLYNLVEATVTNCLDAVSKAAMRQATWSPGDLTSELRREWVRHLARTHTSMGPDKRLEEAIVLCDHLVAALPVYEFDIEKGGGGNWDDAAIKKIASRIGFDLRVSRRADQGVKRKIRNDLGAMALIVSLRNGLAHGRLSFVECGQDDSVAELRALSTNVSEYLREVVAAFISFIGEYGYIRQERRPQQHLADAN
ncbi:MAE_28990/MAE_18760 family HEPN-like nuclease [Agrobacterium tumefaciens]|uniref:MAE_28990/MAE_18760 family HEPN-like nuclease n=1 Tax=Agrobacterium tumefaciens TaxID=358 RepID=UPI000E0C1E5F|nr:MAE_28990/MAE_18760 family HEPN-like nuclease [Agrobacterium tumefaciens]WQE39131.1 MAE_28990/MAE_18760 family HEPN-like nuclease [Agrobacterium tumefaciens]